MGNGLRLLVIDDFAADVVIYYRYILKNKIQGQQQTECEIMSAQTGESGLEAYFTETPDCVLLDYSLPDMTGLEFLEEVQKQTGELPVPIILATGYEDPAVHSMAIENGVSSCYIKGRDGAEQLVNLINQAMSQHQSMAAHSS